MSEPTLFHLEVNPRIPRRLLRLEQLAGNLYYSWDRATRALFARMHPALWEAVGHSPKAMLKRIDEERLTAAASDPVFLNGFNRVLSAFDSYHSEPVPKQNSALFAQGDLIAYFCAEFGFHESMPIYSGGLGILAGDHCKAASDAQLPFVAVGLLYRQGYFVQTIDGEGNQHAEYFDSDFDDLPIAPVRREDGSELVVRVALPGREVRAKVWQARVGHVGLFLLDTDLAENGERDCNIAHQLYGGDHNTRIEQELLLGVGGVRALAAMGIKPTVWHINEGHAAFLVLERIRNLIPEVGGFDAALEAVAARTVFTSHTPVPAGHDQFAPQAIAPYLESYCAELGVAVEKVAALARPPGSDEFNMTTLAVRCSRHHNGVSRIHGGVTSRMLRELWPQIPTEENPVDYVTNGVHIPTFLAPEWCDVFDRFLGIGWLRRRDDPGVWKCIHEIPDQMFWSVRQDLKSQMLHMIRARIRNQHFRNQGSEAHLDRLLRCADPLNPNVLTIGFGRRFATYKRAGLIFSDLEFLRRLLGDARRPVLFIYSGKAHPADGPGQEIIRTIARMSRMPEFEGRILLIEGYDLHLARRLVSGVDVWLNNPVYPMEASGTSGMKAGMNGVINLSVLDGWWGEGYQGDNGWAVKPASAMLDPDRRDREEARTLYEILEDQLVPLYYRRGDAGYPQEWIAMAKRSMASLLPRFNATRMVNEYVTKFYVPALRQGRRVDEHGHEGAKALAAWKARVRGAWAGVAARRLDAPPRRIQFGENVPVEIAVRLNGLAPGDVAVELLLTRGLHEPLERRGRHELVATGTLDGGGEQRYALALKPELCGRLDYRIRVYPRHELLTHPFELGLMLWI
ncbi:MAG: alpha-glucan family phosphorylase [Burkholderiales bacterium]|nr:alpha-glucan family phosphorylase [Burkholderiales bacterium]